jgi:single-stranded-DNA-specific exonuclease
MRHAQPCTPEAIEVLGESDDFLATAIAELEAPLAHSVSAGRTVRAPADAPSRTRPDGPPESRQTLDRRGESPLAVLADAVAAGGQVLAICSDVPRRLGGLSARAGGFALVSYDSLGREPELADRFLHLVALDPPAGPEAAELLRSGAASTYAHLAWGEAELRFAEQMNELEYGLRTSLAFLYRSLRHRERVAGEELERLLRGDGPHGRSARLAGRLVRVLAELELVSLDRDLPALAIKGSAPTALERSAAYRAYAKRHEDGRQYLRSATAKASV